MTHTFPTDNGTRRIAKIGIGEAEFKYQGAELVAERHGLWHTLTIRHDGKLIVLSDISERNIAALKRGLGF